MPTYRPLVALTALVLGVVLAGCSSGDNPVLATPTADTATTAAPTAGTATSPAATGQAVLEIKDYAFSPASLTVAPGATITVVNRDSARHDVDARGKEFKTALLAQDESGTFTAPGKAGSYPFGCSVHPSMTGTLIVS